MFLVRRISVQQMCHTCNSLPSKSVQKAKKWCNKANPFTFNWKFSISIRRWLHHSFCVSGNRVHYVFFSVLDCSVFCAYVFFISLSSVQWTLFLIRIERHKSTDDNVQAWKNATPIFLNAAFFSLSLSLYLPHTYRECAKNSFFTPFFLCVWLAFGIFAAITYATHSIRVTIIIGCSTRSARFHLTFRLIFFIFSSVFSLSFCTSINAVPWWWPQNYTQIERWYERINTAQSHIYLVCVCELLGARKRKKRAEKENSKYENGIYCTKHVPYEANSSSLQCAYWREREKRDNIECVSRLTTVKRKITWNAWPQKWHQLNAIKIWTMKIPTICEMNVS